MFPIIIETPKKCSKCGQLFPATPEFWYRHWQSKDGLEPACKNCRKLLAQRPEQKQRHAKSARRWLENNRVKAYASIKSYEARNPEKVRAIRKKWYLEHLDHIRQRRRRWRQRNPEKTRAEVRNRRARLQASGTITAEDIKNLFFNQEGFCFYCGNSIVDAYHIEHKTPLSRGGANDISNVVLACPSCNLHKGRMTAEEFIANHNPVATLPKIPLPRKALHLSP